MHSGFVAFAVVAGVACSGPAPVCPIATPTRCGDACEDLLTSRVACGACGIACAGGEACVDGLCKASCQSGLTEVAGRCVNLLTDSSHCGAPDNGCSQGSFCSNGTCALACAAGNAACGGSCTDLSTDPKNCGACGTACDPALACWGGMCISPCNGMPTSDGKPVLELAILVPTGNTARVRHSYIIAEQLRQIGVQAVVRQEPLATVSSTFRSATRSTGIKGFDLGFIGTVPVPTATISNFQCGNNNNFSRWCDTNYQAAYTTYRS